MNALGGEHLAELLDELRLLLGGEATDGSSEDGVDGNVSASNEGGVVAVRQERVVSFRLPPPPSFRPSFSALL